MSVTPKNGDSKKISAAWKKAMHDLLISEQAESCGRLIRIAEWSLAVDWSGSAVACRSLSISHLAIHRSRLTLDNCCSYRRHKVLAIWESRPSIIEECWIFHRSIVYQMHNIWVRLNAVIFFGLTVLLTLATLSAIRYSQLEFLWCGSRQIQLLTGFTCFAGHSSYLHFGKPDVQTLRINTLKSL